MSTGGAYQLLVNDGAQDKILLATEALNQHLSNICAERKKDKSIKNPEITPFDFEFSHVAFMLEHFKPFVAMAYEYIKTGAQEGGRLGTRTIFSIPQVGTFFGDMILHVRLDGLAVGPTSTKVRYCEFLGHKLAKLTRFKVNGNFLDQYSSEVYNMEYNMLPSYKKDAWKRNMGQEVPRPAYLTQNPAVDDFREMKMIIDGPQTPKTVHQPVELWIPLMFWFNRSFSSMIPGISIPYGQRFIEIDLARPEEIAQGIPTPDITPPAITNLELYVQNLFVNPEISDVFAKRVTTQLIRVHREGKINVNVSNDSVLVDQFRFPIEGFFAGLRPTINDDSMEDWHRYHFVTDQIIPYPVAVANPFPPPANILAFGNAIYKQFTPTINNIIVKSKDVELWHRTPYQFFNHYVPYRFGEEKVGTFEDPGLLYIPFNLYPKKYQPSGYINASRARNFYITYESSVIGPTIPGYFALYSYCINFVQYSSGMCVLKYVT